MFPKKAKKQKSKLSSENIKKEMVCIVQNIGWEISPNIINSLDSISTHVLKAIKNKLNQIHKTQEDGINIFTTQLITTIKKERNNKRYDVIKLGKNGDYYRVVIDLKNKMLIDISNHSDYKRNYI